MDLTVWIALGLLCTLILWICSAMARYYIKFSLFAIGCLISGSLPIPLMLLNPRNSKNALLPAAGLRLIARILGLTTKVNGTENIVEDSGCVVLINHQSALDLIVLAELWPILDNGCVIAKKEVFWMWPFGLGCWLWGTIFIDRLNGEKAKDLINETGTTIRNRKARVFMFPEGTRNAKKELLPFKKGAFHLALASQCPIQPVIVSSYYDSFLGRNRFDSGEITITILPSIPTSGLAKDDLPMLMDQAYNIMSSYLSAANQQRETLKSDQ